MSQVFRETSFKWQGKDVIFTPSVALLRRIKDQGINNLALAQQCLRGAPDPLDLAAVLRAFLRAGGVDATDDECYLFLVSGDIAGITDFQMAYVSSVMPAIDLGKKPEAPAQEPKKPRAKKART